MSFIETNTKQGNIGQRELSYSVSTSWDPQMNSEVLANSVGDHSVLGPGEASPWILCSIMGPPLHERIHWGPSEHLEKGSEPDDGSSLMRNSRGNWDSLV